MSTDCCKNLIEKPVAKEHFIIRNGKKSWFFLPIDRIYLFIMQCSFFLPHSQTFYKEKKRKEKIITSCGLHFVFSSGFRFYLLSRKLGNNYKVHNHLAFRRCMRRKYKSLQSCSWHLDGCKIRTPPKKRKKKSNISR